jgi:hypothetical protein
MSYAKNRRIKNRRIQNRAEKYMKKQKADNAKAKIVDRVKTSKIIQALSKPIKKKKDNTGLVDKFKTLFKRKVKN